MKQQPGAYPFTRYEVRGTRVCSYRLLQVPPTFASTLAPLETSSSNRETFPSLAAAKISSLTPHSAVFLCTACIDQFQQNTRGAAATRHWVVDCLAVAMQH